MLGAVGKYDDKIVFLLKNGGGLSPIISFTVFLSRKYYSESYGLWYKY